MGDSWRSVSAGDIQAGDVVRTRGVTMTVSRIEPTFLGRPEMLAFIEDTPERWFKCPVQVSAEVEVQSA